MSGLYDYHSEEHEMIATLSFFIAVLMFGWCSDRAALSKEERRVAKLAEALDAMGKGQLAVEIMRKA